MAKRPNLAVAAGDLTEAEPRKRGRPRNAEPGRKGQATTMRLEPETIHRLRIAAAINKTTSQKIIEEAVADWFKRHPLPPGITGVT
jgi:hypothetical protein